MSLAATPPVLKALEAAHVRFCHWKSNVRLAEALAGQTDLDLLIASRDWDRAIDIIHHLGYRGAGGGRDTRHFYGVDSTTMTILHLDLYRAIETGGMLDKPYIFPVADRILAGTRTLLGIPVPDPAAELLLLILRKGVEAASPIEHALMMREFDAIAEEFAWLRMQVTDDTVTDLAAQWFPAVPPAAVLSLCDSFTHRANYLARWRAGRQIAGSLRRYRRASAAGIALRRARRLVTLVWPRLQGKKMRQSLAQPGLVIAFVGGDASGKTTLLTDAQHWLGAHFRTERMHLGKPRPTIPTLLPWLLLPALRRLIPGQRSTAVLGLRETKSRSSAAPGSAFAVRSAMLAHDRASMASRAWHHAKNGAIVFCDRYPSSIPSSTDGPQLPGGDLPPLLQRLAHLERAEYTCIPPPDIVVALRVDLATAQERNRARGGLTRGEDDDWIRLRHERYSAQDLPTIFPGSRIVNVDTSDNREASSLRLRRSLWDAIMATLDERS